MTGARSMAEPVGEGDLSRRDFLVASAVAALGLTGLRVLAERNKRSRRGPASPEMPPRQSEGTSVAHQPAHDDRPIRALVTEDCFACGLCCQVCPEVFAMGSEFAEVIVAEVPEQAEDRCRQAAQDCPAQAIVIKEDELRPVSPPEPGRGFRQ